MKITYRHILPLLFLIGLWTIATNSLYAQLKIPPKPAKATSVYDEAQLLSATEAKLLEQKLIRYADTTSTQIVVATINSLEGEYIGLYATEWAQQWGIGQAKEDNGLFILIAKNDRKIWITTGYGLEEKLTDYNSKTIIDQIITPQFKNGDYYTGLDQGTSAIFQVLDGTFQGSRESKNDFPLGSIFFAFIIFIIIIIAVSKSNHGGGKNGGKRSGASTLLDVIILSSMGRGGFGGGSSGGGSFGGGGGFGGGFGGGGFGGGGAGGSW